MWYFFIRTKTAEPVATPVPTATPTATPTPTPTPLTFELIFKPSGSLTYTSTVPKTALAELEASMATQVLAPGEVRVYTVTDPQGVRKTFPQFIKDLGIVVPDTVVAAVSPADFYMTLYGKTDGKNGRGILIKIQDTTAISPALTTWENSMSTDLAALFKLLPNKAASQTFLNNTYQSTAIRYRNFPDPFSTIDYSLFKLPDATSYLAMVNTRDHVFAILDRAFGAVLGK